MNKIGIIILSILLLFIMSSNKSYSWTEDTHKNFTEYAAKAADEEWREGTAAPYTEEAMGKIQTALTNVEQPKYDKRESKEERARRGVDFWREAFQKAGYDYDETIDKVVYDMRYHPERIPKTNADETVFGFIYITLHMMMSDCEYFKINCLQFFPSKTAESVKWLGENTDFGF
jgi:hypothetical protein